MGGGLSAYTHSLLLNANAHAATAYKINSPISTAAITTNQLSSPSAGNLKERYQVNHLIGRGVSSYVANATDKVDESTVALKRINLTNVPKAFSLNQLADLSVNELKTFKRIETHPFVVTLHAAFHSHSSCYLVMAYLGGGDLRRYLKSPRPLNEECVTYVIGCIGSALHHIHCQGVVHRDLKPENIAFDLTGRPYLTDFGISVVSTEDNPIPICNSSSGTINYMAPEALTSTHLHSHQSDFWSLGVIAYEMLFQQRPFEKHCPISMVDFCSKHYFSMWNELVSSPKASPFIDLEAIFTKSSTNDHEVVDSLFVPLPFFSGESVSLSDEFSSLLNGLLDVRIHARLGNVSKYAQFSDHSLFQKHRFILSEIHRISSPLSSSVECLYPCSASIRGAIAFDDDTDAPFSDGIRDKLSEFHFLRFKDSVGDYCAPGSRSRTESIR